MLLARCSLARCPFTAFECSRCGRGLHGGLVNGGCGGCRSSSSSRAPPLWVDVRAASSRAWWCSSRARACAAFLAGTVLGATSSRTWWCLSSCTSAAFMAGAVLILGAHVPRRRRLVVYILIAHARASFGLALERGRSVGLLGLSVHLSVCLSFCVSVCPSLWQKAMSASVSDVALKTLYTARYTYEMSLRH